MKRFLTFAFVAVAFTAGCGDSSTAVTGTLPVVTGITVDSLASTGDTVVVYWNPVETAAVDGYFLWTRRSLEGIWELAAVSEGTAAAHITDRTAYYSVMAFQGSNTSSDVSFSVNTRTRAVSEVRTEFNVRGVGFRVDIIGDSLIAGDPADPLFAQQFTVGMDPFGRRFIYPGNAHPEFWPGGARTRVSSSGGLVAPAPGDTLKWRDSIDYGGHFFLALENNYYCMLRGSIALPQTPSSMDSLVVYGWIQPIQGLRIFNEL